jgi:hypothetical protein
MAYRTQQGGTQRYRNRSVATRQQASRAIALVVLSFAGTAGAALPIFGTPAGSASGELSVGRSFHWFSITERGQSVASMVHASGQATPVQFGPGGAWAFALPSGTSASAVGVLEDGTRLARLSGVTNGTSIGTRLAFWDAGATDPTIAETLGTPSNGFPFTFAVSHNDSGDVVGYATRYVDGAASGASRPVRWSRDGTITELDHPAANASPPEARAQRVSNTGHIAGWARDVNDAGFRPVRWLPGQTQALELQTFATLAAGQQRRGDVYGVNDAGTVVGTSRHFSNTTSTFGFDRAVRWENGGTVMTVLEGLSTSRSSTAYGVNEAGDTVGDAYPDTGPARAVIWHAGQPLPLVLDTLPGKPSNSGGDRAYAVNRSQSVVGSAPLWVNGSFVALRAALWADGGTALVDLNTLLPANSGWSLEEAGAITDTGFIRGTGNFDPDGTGGVAPYKRSWTLLVPQAGTYGQGDANFDTQVNFDDLLILAQKYSQSNARQHVNVADFDLNGTTDFNDLLTLAQNYQTAGSFEADWALAQSLVPEPGVVVGMLGLSLVRRRRARPATVSAG